MLERSFPPPRARFVNLSLLVTGPLSNLPRYAQAGASVGWEPVVFPLLEVLSRRIQPWREPNRRPDWICVTSQNALPALELEAKRLRDVPCATIGLTSAARLRDSGFRVEVEGARTARELFERLIEKISFPTQVLWPRSSRAVDLGRRLRNAGVDVWDPVAYETKERRSDRIPVTHAVFLASPSAVRAHQRRFRSGEPLAEYAIAIGPTTLRSLNSAHGSDFSRTVRLREPSPAALKDVLIELREKGPFT